MKILASGLKAATQVRNSQGSVRQLSEYEKENFLKILNGTGYKLQITVSNSDDRKW